MRNSEREPFVIIDFYFRAVHKWIKRGTIKADRIGANYAINMKNIAHIISSQPAGH